MQELHHGVAAMKHHRTERKDVREMEKEKGREGEVGLGEGKVNALPQRCSPSVLV